MSKRQRRVLRAVPGPRERLHSIVAGLVAQWDSLEQELERQGIHIEDTGVVPRAFRALERAYMVEVTRRKGQVPQEASNHGGE
jgi:hypothetical protein